MTVNTPGPTPPPPGGDARRRVPADGGSGVAVGVSLTWGVSSHLGGARSVNQDCGLALPPVFAVADGMGGHAAGDEASRCVVGALRRLAGARSATKEMVVDCLAEARRAIGLIRFDSGAPPGSTLSGAIATGDRHGRPCWMVVNLGDSRTYRWHGHQLTQLTADHTVGDELAQYGAAAAEAARRNPLRHKLTRAVLAGTDHEPDVWLVPMEAGDRLLACSDGVYGPLGDQTIAGVLGSAPSPARAAAELVERVVAGGGRDDATAVVVDVRIT